MVRGTCLRGAGRVRRDAVGWAAAGLAAASLSCSQSPVTPSGAVTVATPSVIAPANGAQIANLKQPITLTVTNAFAFVAGGQTASQYDFEVASDAAFASKVQTPSVTPGTNGQTSVVLSALPAAQTYYWHVRANAGGTVGTFSLASTFSVGAAITLGTPTPVSPLAGAMPSGWPIFTVSDAPRSGPVTQVSYKFDVATSTAFSNIVLTATVPESGGQTSYMPPMSAAAPVGTPLYWRVTAIDAPDNITGLATAPETFTPQVLTQQAILAAQLGLTLWPGAEPIGTNGQAVMGNGCSGGGNWQIATCFSPITQQEFQAPTIEALRFFDLFDRGYDPQSAINWMNANGYSTQAEWYPPPLKAVLGLGTFYLAARNQTVGPGTIWDIVIALG